MSSIMYTFQQRIIYDSLNFSFIKDCKDALKKNEVVERG